MKTNRWIVVMMAGALLIATPAWAQRRGGGGGRSSSSAPRSSSMSRGFSGSSRSFSSPSRSFSTPSRSTSSRSYSTPASRTPSRSYSTPGRGPEASATRSSFSGRTPSASTRRVESTTPRTSSSTMRSTYTSRPGASTMRPPSGGVRTTMEGPAHFGGNKGPVSGMRPGYAHPLHPHGPLPPSHRPIRPAPYFYHPIHHHYIHMHPIYWDPFLPPVVYWPGLWSFCVGYWAGSYCSDYTVVHEYVSNTHHVDMIGYAISGDLMYALVRDGDETYLRVFDKADNLLAQHPVNKKYSTLSIDADNGGCWIMKKNDKDPLLFLYADGQLLIYETDD